MFARYISLFSASSLHVLVLTVVFQWTSKTFLFYIFTCAIMFPLLYIYVYMECRKFINFWLATDLKDIKKTYMTNNGCHMCMAEWNGKVVGIARLIQRKSTKQESLSPRGCLYHRPVDEWISPGNCSTKCSITPSISDL